MNYSRRDLGLLLAAAAAASAQGEALPSKACRFEDLPVKITGRNRTRAVLNGETHSGFAIEIHETELAPGEAPHPPHHHVHEELMLVRTGTMEVTISGKVTSNGAGSVVYVASDEPHGWKNAGPDTANYFVITLGRDS